MFRNLAHQFNTWWDCIHSIQGNCPEGTVQIGGGVCVAPTPDILETNFPGLACPPAIPSPNCTPHGSVSKTVPCCTGLKSWNYNANSGQLYDGFACWSAQCATLGQWAGPAGIGNYCCPPLVNVAGKCANAVPGGSGSGTAPVGPAVCKGTLICAVPDMYLYLAGGALVLLMFMGGRK